MPKTIHELCRNGDIDAVRKMVASDTSLVDADDEYQWRPIFHAALHRNLVIVRFLIESGADIAAHDGYVLHYAGEVLNNKEIIRLLITYGAFDAYVRPTDDLSRQFLAAIYLGDVSRLSAMLELHPHLATVVDGRGDYPIHHAARNGDTEIVKLLIDYSADVDATNVRGHTVLYCAGGHGHIDTVQLLLDNDADVEVRFTKDGKNLLEWLAQYPNSDQLSHVAQVLSEHEKKVEQSHKPKYEIHH